MERRKIDANISQSASIDELTEQLANAKLIVLTDYRGLRVAGPDLRTNLRKSGGEIRVAKNTLTRIAAENAGITGLEPYLEGPLAIGIAVDDIVGFSKSLSDFARTSRILTIRGHVLDDRLDHRRASRSNLDVAIQGSARQAPRSVAVATGAHTPGVRGPARSVAYVLPARADQIGDGSMAAD